MRGRLVKDIPHKIILIKYVSELMHCGLREAKEFVEGTYTFDDISEHQHHALGKLFGYSYQHQSNEWTSYYNPS